MKICYLADAGSIHTKRWAEHFAKQGCDVHVVSMKNAGSNQVGNVKYHLMNTIHSKSRFINSLLRPLNLALAVIGTKKMAREIKPDVFHAHFVAEYGLIGALAGCRPLIESVWGSDVLAYPKKSKIWKMLVSHALKKGDSITTTAEFMKGHLIEKLGASSEKIVRIPWGIDLKTFHSGYSGEAKKLRKSLDISDEAPVILSPRNMTPMYQILHILNCIPFVLKAVPDAVFVLMRGYGSKEYEEALAGRARELGVSASTRFVSRQVPPKEMAAYFNMADVFISIPKTDQFASTIMEGMACGAIPVVSRIEPYGQYLKDGKNAFFAEPANPNELADRITHCLKHPEVKKRFSDVNREIIEENENWDRNAEIMKELYEKLSNERSRLVAAARK
ncbi:MAG: glycosyltransferase family 4 protein [Candidatus Thermoplasmatota archaeon]|nr:glycosyltransferase family 4 protein [Candidatus Thermoplasmatota archaeon]